MIYLRSQNKNLLIPLNNPISIVHGNYIGFDGDRWYVVGLNSNYDINKALILYSSEKYEDCLTVVDRVSSTTDIQTNTQIVDL